MAPNPAPEAKPQGTRSSGRHQPPRRLTGPGPDTARPQKLAPTEAHARTNAVNEPAITYDPSKAATLQAMPGPHPQGAELLGFLEQALRRADQPEPAPILDPEGNQYHAHWQRGVPLYDKTSVTVHTQPDLGVDGRLGAYECVGPGWQLNLLLTHVPFGEETKDFLDALSLAYRRPSLPGTHHHHRRPKCRPHRRRPHRSTHSHQHSPPGRHAPAGPH